MIQVEDGATPLEYDEIKGLKPTHITTKGELDALELEKIFNKEPFSWGKVNFSKTGDVRAMYIKALKKADDYDYEALLKFVRS